MRLFSRLVVFLAVAAVLVSCGSVSGPQRGFMENENTFFSHSLPDFKLKIPADMDFIGKMDANYKGLFTNRPSLSNPARISTDTYFMGSKNKSGYMEKGVIVKIDKLKVGFFNSLDLGKVRNKVDSGRLDKGGKEYQYLVTPNLYNFSDAEMAFLSDNGYSVPHCSMGKMITRLCGGNRNVCVSIFYFENLNNQSLICSNWVGQAYLSERQKGYLKDFNDRFESEILITD